MLQPRINGGYGWGIFNGILGWTNSATYSTVISNNMYWICVSSAFVLMRYREVKGHWPLRKPKHSDALEPASAEEGSPSGSGVVDVERVNDNQVAAENKAV